jgi:hypothetical protein
MPAVNGHGFRGRMAHPLLLDMSSIEPPNPMVVGELFLASDEASYVTGASAARARRPGR